MNNLTTKTIYFQKIMLAKIFGKQYTPLSGTVIEDTEHFNPSELYGPYLNILMLSGATPDPDKPNKPVILDSVPGPYVQGPGSYDVRDKIPFITVTTGSVVASKYCLKKTETPAGFDSYYGLRIEPAEILYDDNIMYVTEEEVDGKTLRKIRPIRSQKQKDGVLDGVLGGVDLAEQDNFEIINSTPHVPSDIGTITDGEMVSIKDMEPTIPTIDNLPTDFLMVRARYNLHLTITELADIGRMGSVTGLAFCTSATDIDGNNYNVQLAITVSIDTDMHGKFRAAMYDTNNEIPSGATDLSRYIDLGGMELLGI